MIFPESCAAKQASFQQLCLLGGIVLYNFYGAGTKMNGAVKLGNLIPSLEKYQDTLITPLLGALPEIIMILSFGTDASSQEGLAGGLGVAMGGTTMLLTICWFMVLYKGRRSDRATGEKVPVTQMAIVGRMAQIMGLSTLPYLVLLCGGGLAASLLGLLMCSLVFAAYAASIVYYLYSAGPFAGVAPDQDLAANGALQRQRSQTEAMQYFKMKDDEASQTEEEDEEDFPEDLADLSPEQQLRRLLIRIAWGGSLGVASMIYFADQLVDVLHEASARFDLDVAYLAFVVSPIADNMLPLAMVMSVLPTRASVSHALVGLMGGATIRNTLCMGAFYALSYWKGFSISHRYFGAAVAVAGVQCTVAAVSATSRQQSLSMGVAILCLYPLTIVLAAVISWLSSL